ncbi:metallophosphoesterase family protein [Methylophaga nitratireducenticrescens]|uniref:metallophosphoesterase family protein n=1 Tax=Methylophaga nitratireducenticrescens TaxID=754476 RepID=UPI000CDCD49E|nr:metallophosphoesterase [Methylophaga nitratireducenticrescens]AUZ85260.1 restriction endonuclease subunit S [Methylophaga nitratireducenticrescens]
MKRILHISDLHFGRLIPKVMSVLNQKITELSPERVIISGDLTQRAKTSEFIQAANFLDGLLPPYLITPGNHDLSTFRLHERFLYPWKKWQQFITADLEPTIATEAYKIIGINTARRVGYSTDWSRGRINARQIKRIQDFFTTASPQQIRILVAHHPFWLPTGHQHRGLIGGAETAIQQFQQNGPDIILSGHVHLDYCHVHGGIIISHAGTTTSDRLLSGYPNSFNLLEVDPDKILVSRYHWSGNDFAYLTRQLFIKQTDGWYEQ